MPTALDRRKFRRSVIANEVAREMTEKQLRRNEDGREIEAHAQHYARFGLESAAQEILRARSGDAEEAPVKYEARSMCGKRTHTTGLKMILLQSTAT